ncbi:hypothetical protein MMPV_001220 [Pyropia vietnamensis]
MAMNPYYFHLFAVAAHLAVVILTGGLTFASLMYLNIGATLCAVVALIAGGGLAFVAAPSRAGHYRRQTFSALYRIYLIPGAVLACTCAGMSILGWMVAFKLGNRLWVDPLRSSRLAAMGLGLVGAFFAIIFFVNLWFARLLVPPAPGVIEDVA